VISVQKTIFWFGPFVNLSPMISRIGVTSKTIHKTHRFNQFH
jgi:hypothetical protein